MLAFSIWEAIWLIFVTFVFISVLMMLFSVIVDLFRDESLSGWGKAGWVIVLIFFPFLGLLIYVIARGKGMTERAFKEAGRHQAVVRLLRARPSPAADRRPSSRRPTPCTWPASSPTRSSPS